MMHLELRLLRYFTAVANEGSFTRAAQRICISQPALSRQIHDLEKACGTRLLIRAPHSMRLTEDGLLLRRRAEEILALADRAEQELLQKSDEVSGTVSIAAGESVYFRNVLEILSDLRRVHPGISTQEVTADGEMCLYLLERGLADFAFAYGDPDPSRYEIIPLPFRDEWGAFLRTDDPLAEKDSVTPGDLAGRDLVLSRQAVSDGTHGDDVRRWLGRPAKELRIAGTYTMAYNGALMASCGTGVMLTFLRLVNADDLGLTVRPLSPPLYAEPRIVWKKHQTFSKASALFLRKLREKFGSTAP